MRIHRTSVAAIAAVALALGSVAACGNPAEQRATGSGKSAEDICPTADTGGSIRIGMSAPLMVYAPLLLADSTGAFRDAGLNVELQRVPTADSLPLVAQGRLDGQVTSYSTAHYNVVDAGVALKYVHPFDNQKAHAKGLPVPGYWAHKDLVGSAENPDLSGMRGKKVSTPTGGTGASAKILGDALASEGLNLADVKLSVQVGPDALVALENRAVDMAWISAPLEIEAAKNKDLVPVLGYAPGVTGTSLLAGRGMLDRPDVLVRYLQVMKEVTAKYLEGDYRRTPATVALLAKAAGTTEDVIRQSALLSFDPDFKLTKVDTYLDQLQEFLATRKELKYQEPIPASELIDDRFVKALADCPAPKS
ncbi:ABC transporter substrate-binding protein [Streptomyces sp. CBMA29]|uniref:ABC transporter substrate-binding protein n=1 Tax=Streptomyces sp. CBMA29 TaxID=1896314 RepID=UPI001661A1E3|nr:ABC transporter substrate-binding protein [Streptomyces sp. CBMA29]MBD0736715.1 hypothetical protein [Streptomyces sp. CBMA29]